MKLLIVSYVYAPDLSPRAYRWAAVAEHWAAQGHQVDVVSGWKSGDARHEILNGVRVWRVGNSLVERLRGLLGQRSHGKAEIAAAGPAPKPRLAVRLAKRLYDLTWKRLYWPDYACGWIPAARKQALALARQGGYDALISVSHPFSGHVVGLAVKSALPRLRWIADVGDPFSLLHEIPINNTALYAGLNHRAEARVLERAEKVAVTVASCREAYARAFPGTEAKTVVIPPLLSLPPLDAAPSPLLAGPGKHLVFVGTLYKALRSPAPLLDLFAAMARGRPDLHLHFLGALNDCADLFQPHQTLVGSQLHLHGTVPRALAARAMAGAHLLVNIGNATAHQLPSKLVEYVSTGRPILNLVSTAEDTSVPFLGEYPAALSLVNPGVAEAAKVLELVDAPPPVDAAWVADFLERFRVDSVARAYLDLV